MCMLDCNALDVHISYAFHSKQCLQSQEKRSVCCTVLNVVVGSNHTSGCVNM